MEKRYDMIFGMGPACNCSQTLRRAGLQLLSFPFDWIGPTYKQPGWDDDVRRRTDLIVSRFSNWLSRDDFTCHGNHTNGKAKYYNERLKLIFLHDFPQDVPLAQSFPEVEEKYKRRCGRFLSLLGKVKTVLVVRLDRPDLDYRTPLDDCRYARRLLSEAFAPARFDFLLLQPDENVPFEQRRVETIEDGFVRIAFDYRNHSAETPEQELQPVFSLTAKAIGELFAVRDYRTRAEKKAHRRARRLKHWAEYGADSLLQYHWNKLKARLSHAADA